METPKAGRDATTQPKKRCGTCIVQNQVAVGLWSFSNKPLGSTLLRLAASDQSFAAVALRRSFLAIASHFRYGPGMPGEQLKLSAIRALAASAAQGIESRDAVQHVAAVMILCLFETQQSSLSSNQWLCYLRAAGKVIWQKSTVHQTIFAPLHLWSRVAAEVLPSRDPISRQEAYKIKVARLAEELRNLKVATPLDPAAQRAAAKAEVFRISALVYLSRSTDQNLLRPSELHLLVDRGLVLMENMAICERPLPLLILGCEARTDIERLRILDLVSNTESSTPRREFHSMRMLLQALWTQNDLDSESDVELDYMETLSAILNTSEFLPHFH
ncbi:hypothetical protein CSUB01_07653 [Colletotrichum sublineola]|uniref:Uncharacterized protein n=1 Tax=Colletotrichum sublineola TaxID=1173701 RepID=A0A066XXA1_COLSU|nr:hypothetical protein CSUB01_07653 [Colletotrichum sublineola]